MGVVWCGVVWYVKEIVDVALVVVFAAGVRNAHPCQLSPQIPNLSTHKQANIQ